MREKQSSGDYVLSDVAMWCFCSQVDQYNEMTQKEKPVIIISLTELASIHRKETQII